MYVSTIPVICYYNGKILRTSDFTKMIETRFSNISF